MEKCNLLIHLGEHPLDARIEVNGKDIMDMRIQTIEFKSDARKKSVLVTMTFWADTVHVETPAELTLVPIETAAA